MKEIKVRIHRARTYIGSVMVPVFASLEEAKEDLGEEEALRLLNKQLSFDLQVKARGKINALK